MNRLPNRTLSRALLRATGEADEPKGPPRSIRLSQSLDSLVEGRTAPKTNRADVITDLIKKGLRYERLRQAEGDPALSELLSLMDEMLATRLTEATNLTYRHVFVECLILRSLLEEVLNDARVSSRATERLLTGHLLVPNQAPPGQTLDQFVKECEAEAASVVDEIQGEWQSEMALALDARPDPEAPSSSAHVSPSARTSPDAAAS